MPTPNSLGIISITDAQTPAQKLASAGWAGRHGLYWERGAVLPETQVPACPRVKVADLPEGHLPKKYIEVLEQNQMLKSCCRHPENHEVEARKTHPDEPAPDIYIFYCTCGRVHRRLCVGKTDTRPVWDAA